MHGISFPVYQSRFPWLGRDLQTIRNVMRGVLLDPALFPSRRLYLPMGDGSGDKLAALVQIPAKGRPGPLIVLVHGLTGDEESIYMQHSAAFFLHNGYRTMRLNLRGAGASRQTCRYMYHAGRSGDLRDALYAMPRDLKKQGFYIVGFSLGGNMLLKFMSEYGSDFPIKAAVSVSAPIDLSACNRQMLKFRNTAYQCYVMKCLKEDALGESAELTENERRAILESGSVYEFDNYFNAPRNGYATAEEYYEKNMALRFMGRIRTPTLLIHALNDPWIPARAYTDYAWESNTYLIPLFSHGGGHVGFHSKGSVVPWHDRCAQVFFRHLESQF
jgi:uncharacterized protein